MKLFVCKCVSVCVCGFVACVVSILYFSGGVWNPYPAHLNLPKEPIWGPLWNIMKCNVPYQVCDSSKH